MTNDLDVFFPYLLLLCCLFFCCTVYRIIRIGAFCTYVSGPNCTLFGRRNRGSNPSNTQQNAEHHVSIDQTEHSEISETAVEDLLRQNLVSAIIAGREARRLANILASSRGISTEECLDSARASRHTSSADAFVFSLDEDDLPPSYEACVSPPYEAPKV